MLRYPEQGGRRSQSQGIEDLVIIADSSIGLTCHRFMQVLCAYYKNCFNLDDKPLRQALSLSQFTNVKWRCRVVHNLPKVIQVASGQCRMET